MNNIFNKTEYKQRRQALRRNLTEPEKRLWQVLRNKQMGEKFRRQHGIGHYIVDFYCPALKLVIEVDGDSHFTEDAQRYDRERNKFMSSLGMTTLRFKNDEVMSNLEGVCQSIQQQIDLKAQAEQVR
jgi:very-short-patch-repair endonuclease